jgi:hypothetical protein
MHQLTKIFLASIALCGLSACGPKDPSQPKPPPPITGGVIPQAQLDALNKAKNVESVLQKEAQQRGEKADQ